MEPAWITQPSRKVRSFWTLPLLLAPCKLNTVLNPSKAAAFWRHSFGVLLKLHSSQTVGASQPLLNTFRAHHELYCSQINTLQYGRCTFTPLNEGAILKNKWEQPHSFQTPVLDWVDEGSFELLLNYTVLKRQGCVHLRRHCFGALINYTILKPAPTSYRFTSSFEILVNYAVLRQRNFNWRFELLPSFTALKLTLCDIVDMHLHFQAMELQNERGHNYTVPKPSGEPVRLLSGFGVLLNYTALKQNQGIGPCSPALRPLLNYTALKRAAGGFDFPLALRLLLNYTALKRFSQPQCLKASLRLLLIYNSQSTPLKQGKFVLQNERGHNYTALKRWRGLTAGAQTLRLILNYTALKPKVFSMSWQITFGLLLNYTAFKPLTKVKANSHFEY